MSNSVITWVMNNSTTKGSKRLVLLVLANSANDEGICWPGMETIARQANCSRRFVIDILSELEKEGHIEVTRRKRPGKKLSESNLYRVITGVVNYTSLPEGEGVVNQGSPGVVNHTSPGSEAGLTTGSEPGLTRVVRHTSPKPLIKPHKETSINQYAIPESLSTPEFLKVWSEFQEHRKQLKKKLTQLAGEKLLKKLSGYPVETAIAMVEQSIENDWQGVFEVKTQNGRSGSRPAAVRKNQPSPEEVLRMIEEFQDE